MKLKVLIVDDEKLERVLIEKGFSWEEHGFTLIGEASNGEEALAKMADNPPNIVFTDINMPKMNGLSFTEQVKIKFPKCRIVIITGYREFEYARQAVRLGVTDFLLKPVNMEEISLIALRLKEEFEKEENETQLKDVLDSHEHIKKLVTSYIDREQNSHKKDSPMIAEAISFIESHLTEKGLSLKQVATAIFVNESYLSRSFKQETGESLIEYITKRRIEESIILLNTTDLKVYEIADQTGFADPHYFSICFKKLVGKTVKEFKGATKNV